ncbi:hypothetical protein FRC17_002749, partial [Serendipita sp. 399]
MRTTPLEAIVPPTRPFTGFYEDANDSYDSDSSAASVSQTRRPLTDQQASTSYSTRPAISSPLVPKTHARHQNRATRKGKEVDRKEKGDEGGTTGDGGAELTSLHAIRHFIRVHPDRVIPTSLISTAFFELEGSGEEERKAGGERVQEEGSSGGEGGGGKGKGRVTTGKMGWCLVGSCRRARLLAKQQLIPSPATLLALANNEAEPGQGEADNLKRLPKNEKRSIKELYDHVRRDHFYSTPLSCANWTAVARPQSPQREGSVLSDYTENPLLATRSQWNSPPLSILSLRTTELLEHKGIHAALEATQAKDVVPQVEHQDERAALELDVIPVAETTSETPIELIQNQPPIEQVTQPESNPSPQKGVTQDIREKFQGVVR